MTAHAHLMPTTRIELMSDALAADPWPALRELREQGPVVWHEVYRRWIVTTDRAAREILSDFRRFTVLGTSIEVLFGADAFISMDDRRAHDNLRNLWAASFRPSGVGKLQGVMAGICDELLAPVLERLRAGEVVELTESLCRPLPTLMIGHMMGVPREMLPDIVRWSDEMAAGGPAYSDDADGEERARAVRESAKAALADCLLDQIAKRRRNPGDDLISRIAVSDVARTMADEQIIPNLRQLFFAGNETTARWLAHIMVTYGERPDLWRALRADRALVPAANDEVMRWQGVVGTVVRRVCGGPVTIAGAEMADGDDVTCILPCANRDPARYSDPDRFDPYRSPLPNLGFGFGFHTCLGAVLAKVESTAAVNALLDALPGFRIAAPIGYTSLPMRGPTPVIAALD
jgi:cytochrome P450